MVTVELAEPRTARIVWADVFDRTLDNALLVLDEIGDRIVVLGEKEDRVAAMPPFQLS